MKYENIKIGMKVKVKKKDHTSSIGCSFSCISNTCGETHKVKEIYTIGGTNHFKLSNNLLYPQNQLKKAK